MDMSIYEFQKKKFEFEDTIFKYIGRNPKIIRCYISRNLWEELVTDVQWYQCIKHEEFKTQISGIDTVIINHQKDLLDFIVDFQDLFS